LHVINVMNRDKTLSYRSTAERHPLLAEWNNTQTDYPYDQCIQHLFEAQVAHRPDATAIVAPVITALADGGTATETLTYDELNRRANQLAHYLQQQGVGPEVIVGICVKRSVEMMVGLWGILKAGGAYLPLDPTYPKERLAFMLQDAGVSLLLTQQSLAAGLPTHEARTLCLDTDWAAISRASETNPTSTVTPKNLAYVIYTSGSTGQPKGVQIIHRALINFFSSMRRQPGMTDLDTVLAITTLSFDVSVLELFLPLIVGGCLVLISRAVAADGFQLLEQLSRSGATIMQATPATWRLLLAAGWQKSEGLKILCGGEALSRDLADQLLERGTSVWNLYGPTETTVWSALHRVTPGQGAVSIGRPLANTQIYLLDEHLQPVPAGHAGELYLGGHGLSRGYLNRPELTAEKFIPHPFSREPGARLYRTGDLARYLPNGKLEFLGRVDHQVKIRGFRIELQEIEAVLRQHAHVHEAVVVAQAPQPDSEDKRLVAYVTQNAYDDTVRPETQIGQTGQLIEWETIWDETYGQKAAPADPTFNISGWHNSYTGRPMSADIVREWIQTTVDRILSPQPERVLELGCGTGLLLFRIAPHCASYWGTDLAEEAVQYLRQQVAGRGQELSHVKLFRQAADDFAGVEPESFDAVIINSVIQYFPGVDYLLRVLEGAIAATAPGGCVFVGDVRSLPLLETFHTSVQMHQAPASLTKAQLRQRVHRHVALENQLLVDPAFFVALKEHLPRLSHVQIQLKRGRDQNEMTRFRYDVTLHVETELELPNIQTWLNWDREQLTIARLRQQLLDTMSDTLGLTQVPNARLLTELKTVEWLATTGGPKTVGSLRQALLAMPAEAGVEPEDLWALGDELGYTVHITWSDAAPHDRYDVVFVRQPGDGAKSMGAVFPLTSSGKSPRPWRSYANDPLQSKIARQLVPELRRFLKTKLPDYMLPEAIVLLEKLPLTPNGKVNRRALPAPTLTRVELKEDYVAPRNRTEHILARLWAEVLEIEPVGINDNFFELGGHSILATQLVSRIRQAFELDLLLPTLFEAPTIALLAERIETICWAAQHEPLVSEVAGRGREQGAL
jgi:amino acid adenylation domain-containing protein